MCRMAARALSGLRDLAPGSSHSQARQAQRRRAIRPSAGVCGGWRLVPYPDYVIWHRVRPLRRPGKRSAAGQSGRVPVFVADGGSCLIRTMLFGTGFAPFVGPASAAPPGNQAECRCLWRMVARALSGLRDLAPGSPPLQARQAQRRRTIYPTPCRVCAGWRLAPYPAYVIWRRVHPLRRPGKRSAAGQYTRHRAACVADGGSRLIRHT
ncbi:Uncharacterised protein [Klebsiella pneumoniae]|nr:Uncharacterised protein [Klebsiella pneumoniae]VGA02071.1 Uncharacterised protein [Klebsiella pneumoniae]